MEGLKEILRYEKAHGITSYCPTSMTLPKDDLLKIFGTIEAIKDEPEAEVIAGVNMEGPFIDPIKKGAQAEENIVAPNAEFFRACNAAERRKNRLVTLAPNMRLTGIYQRCFLMKSWFPSAIQQQIMTPRGCHESRSTPCHPSVQRHAAVRTP